MRGHRVGGIAMLVVLCLTMVLGSAGAMAQEPACRFFRVNTSLINVAKEPRADAQFIDVLEDGEVACVTREQKVGDRTWVYVAHKQRNPGDRKVVEGWAILRHMIQLSAA